MQQEDLPIEFYYFKGNLFQYSKNFRTLKIAMDIKYNNYLWRESIEIKKVQSFQPLDKYFGPLSNQNKDLDLVEAYFNIKHLSILRKYDPKYGFKQMQLWTFFTKSFTINTIQKSNSKKLFVE